MSVRLMHGLATEDRGARWGKRTLCGQVTKGLPRGEGYYSGDPVYHERQGSLTCPACRVRLPRPAAPR